jgi:hypothetical protein
MPWLGVMFQPLTLAVVGRIRLYQRIGTLYAWGQRVAFEFANKTRALAPVDGHCLANAGARRDSGRSTRST